jgi:hypothetical protein
LKLKWVEFLHSHCAVDFGFLGAHGPASAGGSAKQTVATAWPIHVQSQPRDPERHVVMSFTTTLEMSDQCHYDETEQRRQLLLLLLAMTWRKYISTNITHMPTIGSSIYADWPLIGRRRCEDEGRRPDWFAAPTVHFK